MPAVNFAVLVVDDEKMVQQFFKRTLEDEGYQVLTASNGDEALSIVANFTIHVVVTDIKMPIMDGVALGMELARLPEPPEVVYASASDTPPAGVDHAHYLQKPFTGDVLKRTVNALLHHP